MKHIYILGHHSAGCGITDEISQWMESIQNGAQDTGEMKPKPKLPPIPLTRYKSAHEKMYMDAKQQAKAQTHSKNTSSSAKRTNHVDFDIPGGKYSREANEGKRTKRATKLRGDRNTCSLYIQTDPLIWKHIREGFPEVSNFFWFTSTIKPFISRIIALQAFNLNYKLLYSSVGKIVINLTKYSLI